MSAEAIPSKTFDEYLAIEEETGIKHEYYRGQVYAMTGASARHNLIVSNIIASLHQQLRQSPCRVFPSDLRLQISQTGLYTYPDISVACGTLEFGSERPDTLLNPTCLIEVLSPSTENYDRGMKFEHYRTISSLQIYLVIAQDRCHCELYLRQTDHRWLLIEFWSLEQTIQLEAIEAQLKLNDVYEYIELA